MTTKINKTVTRSWSGAMINVTYICVGLTIILVAAQFWLYSLRYQRVFAKQTWHAVTLTNGQTYFGQLEQYGPNTVVLFHVYYLQAGQTTQPSDAEAEAESDNEETSSDTNLQLFHVTDDLHQPYDYLIINRNQILYWQHLTADSPIVNTIENNT